MKILVVLFLVVILYCLGSGLVYLVREKNETDARAVVRALTWRITLSLTLFFLLMLSYWMGWIHPHAV